MNPIEKNRAFGVMSLAAGLAVLLVLGARVMGRQESPGKGPAEAKTETKGSSGSSTTGAAKPSELEDLLAQALQNNPDLRVAAAKVAEAEAVLNQVRLQVAQKVVSAYNARDVARTVVADAEQRLARVHNLSKSGTISQEEVKDAERALMLAKAKLTEAEAELPYLTGKQAVREAQLAARLLRKAQAAFSPDGRLLATGDLDGAVRVWDTRTGLEVFPPGQGAALQGSTADKIRKALDQKVKVNFQNMPFADVLKFLEITTGVSFRNTLALFKGGNPSITLQFNEPLPVGALLEALEDSFLETGAVDKVQFVIRDYGFLVVMSNRKPPDAISLLSFWKNPPPAPKTGK